MTNTLGRDVRTYRDVVIRNSLIGDHSILADDVFVTDSSIGNHCTIERRGMIFNSSISDYSYTGYNTVVKHAKIGKFCSISWNVTIGGADHDYHRISTHPFGFMPKYGFTEKAGSYSSFDVPLQVGNDVWIGCNAVILRGITIGDGAVIGASAVLTADIPPYSIVVGNPGKVIKTRFSNSIIDKMEQMRWWDWDPDFIRINLSFFQNGNLTLPLLNELNEKYALYCEERTKQ